MNLPPQYAMRQGKRVNTSRRSYMRHTWRMIFAPQLVVISLNGCGSLLPKILPEPPKQATLYMLDGISADSPTSAPMQPIDIKQLSSGAKLPALTISTPIAAAGFGGVHMVYQRKTHELEHFALNQWVDTPAQMLAPLIVRAVENSGAFRAVVRSSTGSVSDFRLDTEIVRLQQNFIVSPSETRLTLRAVMVHTATRRVVASREFDASMTALSDDPRGGVEAANQAVRQVLAKLAKFCTEAVAP